MAIHNIFHEFVKSSLKPSKFVICVGANKIIIIIMKSTIIFMGLPNMKRWGDGELSLKQNIVTVGMKESWWKEENQRDMALSAATECYA